MKKKLLFSIALLTLLSSFSFAYKSNITDFILSHTFSLLDTTKPVIIHEPIGPTPKISWPVSVNAVVTDSSGLDSVWVKWYKNTTALTKRFRLNNTGGNNYSALFNSVNAEVAPGDVIYYKIFAQDSSVNHNKDSTPFYQFNIIFLTGCFIGLDTLSSNYPFTTYWMDGRTQMLFTASELQNCGYNYVFLTSIGFNVKSFNSQLMNGFNIRFQHTNLTSLTGWVTSGWTTVYSGNYNVIGTGMRFIYLTPPYFVYNGTSNLLVEICYDNSSYTQYSVVNSTPAPGKTWGFCTNNSSGCTLIEGAALTNRPNIILSGWTEGIYKNGNGIPEKLSLFQNYPNPFNPVTRIDFDIPKNGFVSLRVFDILGREVQTIVNEIKTAGSYSVDFNGSDLTSGVYFYRLESEGISDVKRMVLIK